MPEPGEQQVVSTLVPEGPIKIQGLNLLKELQGSGALGHIIILPQRYRASPSISQSLLLKKNSIWWASLGFL